MQRPMTATETRDHIVEALEARREQIARAASLWHGFEGWLKVELASSFMTAPQALAPWCKTTSGDWEYGHVGVEARMALGVGGRRGRGTDDQKKLVDLWVAAAPDGNAAHYFELKVVFNNSNQDKMTASWVEDMRLLARLAAKTEAVGVGSIVLAVGFDSVTAWRTLADAHAGNLAALRPRDPFELVRRSDTSVLVIVDMLFAEDVASLRKSAV